MTDDIGAGLSTGHNNSRGLESIAEELKASGAPFVVATVVRTVAVTAAKPGAKAIIAADGTLLTGWIGGGCARHSVVVAAKKAMEDGQPRLVQLQPEELLNEQGLIAGTDDNGVLIARNMCPSQGTMDIFVEPVLSNPELLVLGRSPIALPLAEIGLTCGFSVVMSEFGNQQNSGSGDTSNSHSDTSYSDTSYSETDEPQGSGQIKRKPVADIPVEHPHRYTVIATQGTADLDTIKAALSLNTRYLAFVGSRKKIKHLQNKLQTEGYSESDRQKLTGPAGLDIGGVTPQEIALSILAEIVQLRRADRINKPIA
jgi:xanthine dehydrogenase accessory factor